MNNTQIYILHIETSTKACSVALSQNSKCIGFKEFLGENFSHAETLPTFIDEIIEESSITKDQLSAIAISGGPGSYTGLRIGCSTAKGLSFALKIPLISVDTMEIPKQLVKEEIKDNEIVISVMKARLKEVFSSITLPEQEQKSEIKYVDVAQDKYETLQNNAIVLVGNASNIVLDECQYQKWRTIELPNHYSAKGMVDIAYSKFVQNDFEDLAYYEPAYLKDFVVLKKKVKK